MHRLFCCGLVLGVALPAGAITPGVYRDSSREIAIVRRGNRWCYQGSSPNGVRTATILYQASARRQLIFGWHQGAEAQQLYLEQLEPRTLTFGGITYALTAEAATITGDLQNCLASPKPVVKFRELSPTRGAPRP
ncbi:MAG: hypothetical protein HC919_13985 [Oscillatoriales cyanobacterium SM2_2_1]|nr:hypothetical protein [Oscillatoriales cyanobacterium SM2_2_1]